MKALAGVLRWLLRRGLLFAMLFLAIGFGTFAGDWLIAVKADSQRAWRQGTILRTETANLRAVLAAIEDERPRLLRDYERRLADLQRTSGGLRQQGAQQLDAKIARTRTRIAAQEQSLRAIRDRPLWKSLRDGPEGLVAQKRGEMTAEMELALLRSRLALLQEARADIAVLAATARKEQDIAAGERRVAAATRACDDAGRKLSAYRKPHFWSQTDPGTPLYRWLRDEGHARLLRERDGACARAAQERDSLRRTRMADIVAKAMEARLETGAALAGKIDGITAQVQREGDERRGRLQALQGTFLGKLQLWLDDHPLGTVFRQALAALILIVAMPYLIRLLFWFVMAPLAERRPAIRLAVPGGSGAIPPAGRSTTSVAVRLAPGEELLVRQDYLQTTSHTGSKGTQWLLDWRHPFASLVTGMAFLTRIRGEGEVTTVSAVRDPFAEVAILTLPAGTACVLQPRALAAVAKPETERLRVTSHWRLFSLNAWLTLQLRYIVFHGPCRLVVKGGRGVRVERAGRGRVFGPAQLVGFSADLAYSVTRTETFWPYFLGREQLFKDRVEAGAGILVIEEAPLAGRAAGPVRAGLEGAFDVATKALGI